MPLRSAPEWIGKIGIELAEDLGNGMGVSLLWRQAKPANYNNSVHYNIYIADSRFSVLESKPRAITLQTSGTVFVEPGNLHFFVVRATEFDISKFDISELEQISDGVFAYPASAVLNNDVSVGQTTVVVNSTDGFPNKGYLKINFEILYYYFKDSNTFYIDSNGRAQFVTIEEQHIVGDAVELFKGVEDGNTIVAPCTAAWTKEGGIPRDLEHIGEFNVGEDGYRSNHTDIITTDLSASDNSTSDFPNYDYAGYHRPSMQAYFKGGCINSYAWGELNGERGIGLQDQQLSRLDMLLQNTGEPVVLLKRKQTGKRCRCIDLRREHQQQRCQFCFGTGFDGGYDRYYNNRPISEYDVNNLGRILIRVDPYDDDVKLEQANGISQVVELNAWTINLPTVKDRDIIIRYLEDGTEEFRYECLSVTRNKLMFNLTGSQKFKIKRLDKTSIIYSFVV